MSPQSGLSSDLEYFPCSSEIASFIYVLYNNIS